jgi:glycosyltransferase involved in cell wall biosynthesis
MILTSTMRRTAVLVAYLFPPLGGVGVQRALNLCKYLPLQGYRVIVITGPGSSASYWTPLDPTLGLVDACSEHVRVERVSGPEPSRGATGARLDRALGRWSPVRRWFADGAAEVARRLGEKVDVVLTELGPYETALAGQRVASIVDAPLVVDLQDPWALDEMWLHATVLHRRLDRRRMKQVLFDADRVIMNTPEAARRALAEFPDLHGRLTSIPNGYDEDDFKGPAPERSDGRFRLVHSGSLHTEMGLRHRRTSWLRRALGGMPVPGVDFLSRSHYYLVAALELLAREAPELAALIDVHLVGVTTAIDLEIASRLPGVRVHGFVSHEESVRLLRSADLLFLPMHTLPPGMRAGLVPAKTYEYVAARRPILAAVPEGDVRDLLSESGAATLVAPDDVEGLARALQTHVLSWREGRGSVPVSAAVLERLTYRHLTACVAHVLEHAAESCTRPLDVDGLLRAS